MNWFFTPLIDLDLERWQGVIEDGFFYAGTLVPGL